MGQLHYSGFEGELEDDTNEIRRKILEAEENEIWLEEPDDDDAEEDETNNETENKLPKRNS